MTDLGWWVDFWMIAFFLLIDWFSFNISFLFIAFSGTACYQQSDAVEFFIIRLRASKSLTVVHFVRSFTCLLIYALLLVLLAFEGTAREAKRHIKAKLEALPKKSKVMAYDWLRVPFCWLWQVCCFCRCALCVSRFASFCQVWSFFLHFLPFLSSVLVCFDG